MQGRYSLTNSKGSTYTLIWDEQRNSVELWQPDTKQPGVFMTYDSARLVLDLLMAVFGKHELSTYYPELRGR